MSRADFPEYNRRHFLKHLAGMSALALPSFHFLSGLRAAEGKLKKEGKSLIVLWMGGGPSHMDLWDLKPGQPTGGEFKPIKTSVAGIEISEILPNVAKQFKNLSIVRSLASNEGSHERGTELMNTGRMPSPVVQYPAIGAMASSLLTPKDLPLPGFIGIGGTAQRIGSGFLGMMHAPFTIQNPGQPPANVAAPASLGNANEAMDRQHRRERLFREVEGDFSKRIYPDTKKEERKDFGDAALAHSDVYNKAFDLTGSSLKTVFDVRTETAKVKEMYGGEQNNFGMGCLLARKLVEKGVTCVEVDLGGWDNHANIFTTLKSPNGNGKRLDQGMAGLMQDLDGRGLLKNTVVVWMGEFGRTPRINQNAGRDHWGRCWSVVLGGGGIKGGQVFGATTKDGMDIEKDKVSVGDLFATIYKGLGLDPTETKVRDNLGRPTSIADGKPISALLG
jgi:hypothetical protein